MSSNCPPTTRSDALVKKGGRKTAGIASPETVQAIEAVVKDHTAGSPVDPDIRWTNRSPRDIAHELHDDWGISLHPKTVRRILRDDLGLRKRATLKSRTHCHDPDRDAQFQNIAQLRRQYERNGWPVLSIDSKKKELLGDFRRAGSAWTNGRVTAPDHDFPSQASGKLTPFGVYDCFANEGFMLLTTGAETGQLACDGVRRWWYRLGQRRYRGAGQMLLLCDCGGGNGYRNRLFKQSLQQLAERLNMTIRVAHYPTGCSKYNPIEHRMFCHVSRSLQGVALTTVDTAKQFIEQTRTGPGLTVIAEQARRIYATGVQVAANFMKSFPIHFDKILPRYNYFATS